MMQRAIEQAVETAWTNNPELFRVDIAEMSLSHQIANELKTHFPDYHVDVEHNRDLETDQIKKCGNVIVRPDIIVHRRTHNRNNLVVIEVKKSTNPQGADYDLVKLRLLLRDFGYDYAFFILLYTGEEYRRRPEVRAVRAAHA